MVTKIKKRNESIVIPRRFSQEGKESYNLMDWTLGPVSFGNFKQENVEYPSSWTSLSSGVAASKYFYGEPGTDKRENSIKQLVSRVSESIGSWGNQRGYLSPRESTIFSDELAGLALGQYMAFNSPVWFNVGIDRYSKSSSKERKHSFIIGPSGRAIMIQKCDEYKHPQTSACFIQGLEDTMEDIMDLAKREAMLFKYGSGTGTDLSTLRSSREKLSNGGKPSGPLKYLTFWSQVAGIVQSGGKTRRAAKMNSLQVEHPDIKEFIECKMFEKKKALALVVGGYSPQEAMETVAYQNANLSIRASDKFMQAVESNSEWRTVPVNNPELADKMPQYKAKDLMKLIAQGTWECGDPGMQFDTTINKWHTCPNSGRINASNPCSEYMFINDSACNLASLNLLKFLSKEGRFDVDGFSHAARLTAIAQDILIDQSSYPAPKIAENAHKFRPLGQGYANLGALLMNLGLPYDSDNGRAIAASISALQTGKVYEASIEMAKKLGTFQEFDKNRTPMLNVMEMHRDSLKGINREKLPSGLESVLDEAFKTWEGVLLNGSKYGFRNSQATVLAPTGTIGFMMGCDTMGIEPDYSLLKTKQLAGGGSVEIVNGSVVPALVRLGYNGSTVQDIEKHIKKHKTIEGAPGLKEEHLAIFDCANPFSSDGRSISPMGHLSMMAAIQPFLSGAISKTVNLASRTNPEEIEKVYMDAWKMGLKAVALYRDGSHILQPLLTQKNEEKSLEGKANSAGLARPLRKKLPGTRDAEIHKFNIAGHEGYLTVGLNKDRTPGETFITMSKEGSTIGGLMDVIGTETSLLLQYGVPVSELATKFKGQKFDPHGIVLEGHPDIKVAKSIPDYIFSYLEKRFPSDDSSNNARGSKTVDVNGFENSNENTDKKSSEGDEINWNNLPFEERGSDCPICSHTMRRVGHCAEYCECGHKNNNGCGE